MVGGETCRDAPMDYGGEAGLRAVGLATLPAGFTRYLGSILEGAKGLCVFAHTSITKRKNAKFVVKATVCTIVIKKSRVFGL